jgi:hypothetical protein
MRKIIYGALGLLSTGFIVFLAIRALNQSDIKEKLNLACVYGLMETHSSMQDPALRYGKGHEQVSKSLSLIVQSQQTGALDQDSFLQSTMATVLAYIPAALRTCNKVMAPTFRECLKTENSSDCIKQTANGFSQALQVMGKAAQARHQKVDMAQLKPEDLVATVRKGD